ncbi:cytochrome c [Pseudoflavitalea sp. G-6-1-2]|uniref:c-type cytochrome n=1 Tax=Pseudoflavitalea sp. G-6-1-2 TaxID=2728841 RepID=UPI00146C58D7|nr:cytochrome c [Pseudoflavitalea sp. G-6-1-2]NML20624.1 cytochrome c [Pseudoflavitalea sp. G-6-1-2]
MKKYYWLVAGLLCLAISCSEFGVPDPKEERAFCGNALIPDSVSSSDIAHGSKLFNDNCTTCHHISKDLAGPPLFHITQRLKQIDPEHPKMLYDFTRNSTTVMREGNIYFGAQYLYWNGLRQNYFPVITDEELRVIYAYIDQISGRGDYKPSELKTYAPYFDSCLENLMKAGYLISWDETMRMKGTLVIRHKSRLKIEQFKKNSSAEFTANDKWEKGMHKQLGTRLNDLAHSSTPYKVFFKDPNDAVRCGCASESPSELRK